MNDLQPGFLVKITKYEQTRRLLIDQNEQEFFLSKMSFDSGGTLVHLTSDQDNLGATFQVRKITRDKKSCLSHFKPLNDSGTLTRPRK